MSIRVQIGNDNGANLDATVFGDVIQVRSIQLNCPGHCQPATLSVVVAYNSLVDNAGSGVEILYQFKAIRIVDTNQPRGQPVLPTDPCYFVGRIDDVILRNALGERQWELQCRDWLSVLADSSVGPGLWFPEKGDSLFSGTNAGSRGIDSSRINQAWSPIYVGDYLAPRAAGDNPPLSGEFRKNIIWDLACNVIHDPALGLEGVQFAVGGTPNSAQVEKNFANNTNVPILDVIRSLAEEDVWSFTLFASEVDAFFLSAAGWDAPLSPGGQRGAGIGGEFHIQCNTVSDSLSLRASGKVAIYTARGAAFQSAPAPTFIRPPLNAAAATKQPTGMIVDYQFQRTGSDIYSRSRASGVGDSTYSEQQPGNSTWGGVVQSDLETGGYDPATGKFHIRREVPNGFNWASVGDWIYRGIQGIANASAAATRARSITDVNYSQMFTGGGSASVPSNLSSSDGGYTTGTITLAGPPRANKVTTLRPGYLCYVEIPERGILLGTAGSVFTVDSWTWVWPENLTIVQLSRPQKTSTNKQLVDLMRRTTQAVQSDRSHYSSGWVKVDHSGTMTFNHKLGIKPRGIRILSAHWAHFTDTDTPALDPNGNPLPDLNTETLVGEATMIPGNNIVAGAFHVEVTAEKIVIKYGRNIAYSDGFGSWLRSDSDRTLLEVTANP